MPVDRAREEVDDHFLRCAQKTKAPLKGKHSFIDMAVGGGTEQTLFDAMDDDLVVLQYVEVSVANKTCEKWQDDSVAFPSIFVKWVEAIKILMHLLLSYTMALHTRVVHHDKAGHNVNASLAGIEGYLGGTEPDSLGHE
eukprot:14978424-Ditylum_brightwellii.AAC.1